jgi:hypothetical protein
VNRNFLALKIRDFQVDNKNNTANFLKMALTIFIKLQKCMKTIFLNKTA